MEIINSRPRRLSWRGSGSLCKPLGTPALGDNDNCVTNRRLSISGRMEGFQAKDAAAKPFVTGEEVAIRDHFYCRRQDPFSNWSP